MASIKQITDRKYKITISNGYRTDGRKICKTKTIQVPDSVPKRGIEQYVYHEAERLERLFKQGYSEDDAMTFETYAAGWSDRRNMRLARSRFTGGRSKQSFRRSARSS